QDRVGAPRARASAATSAAPYVEEALRWLPPAGAEDHGDHPASAPRPFGNADRDKRILLADDNADMREYIRRILGERWIVEAVGDGAAALAAARRSRPDLIVTDVMMPHVD